MGFLKSLRDGNKPNVDQIPIKDMDIDQTLFCYVPEGKFIMGAKRGFYSSACPSHAITVKDFWIGQFPVTNLQFTSYLNSTDSPLKSERGSFQADLPAVNLTWFDMRDFTFWLTSNWQGKGFLPQDLQVTLPSEAEWEKAARGGIEIPKMPVILEIGSISRIEAWEFDRKQMRMKRNPAPLRVYPWGDVYKDEKANISEAGIRKTSSVDQYPQGVSPYGVMGMIGNIWEWTRSLDGDYPYPDTGKERAERERIDSYSYRIARGGSYDSDALAAQCVSRRGIAPKNSYADLGFRLVIKRVE